MTPIDLEVAKNIKFYRKERGLTQSDLATKLGVGNTAVSGWEVGRNSIDLETLAKICKILDVTIKDMYGKYGEELEQNYTDKERKIIRAYRNHPEIQHAVDLLLGLSDTSED